MINDRSTLKVQLETTGPPHVRKSAAFADLRIQSQGDTLQLLQTEVLEMVARGEPLESTARALCMRVEAILPEVVCSIITADAGRLKGLAAPSLPDAYREAFDGLAIGPDAGSCGSAMHTGQPVEASDISTDPRWVEFAHLPLALGLKACWSTPVIGKDGEVLGAFAFYFREARSHTIAEAEIVQASVHLCAIAIERDRQTAALNRLAYQDLLTGLPNRAAFNAVSDRMGASEAHLSGLLVIDLDNLKTINDTFGQRVGDGVIQAAAARIEQTSAPFRVFRLGGDEFAVLIGEARLDRAGIETLANEILAALSEEAECEGHAIQPRATIGGAFALNGDGIQMLRQNADFALHHAKETRRGGFVLHSPVLGSRMTRRLDAIRAVSAALCEDRIDAYYQPIVRLDTGEIVGLEALFRVITAEGQVLPAGDYFEATSDVHTAIRLTRRMLDIVAHDVRIWLEQGIWFQHIGINASSADFQSGRLLEALREAFDREGVPLKHVILEVTESVYMGHDGDGVGPAIQELRAKGLRVALDDFGTGFASLTHLLSVPVDVIKIDKSFVSRMEPGNRGGAIVEGMLAIATKLGIRVVAEGVETHAQAEQLRRWGCLLGQGFLYSRAVDRQVITALLFEKAQRQDSDSRLAALPGGSLMDVPFACKDKAGEQVVRYAILLCGTDWRVVSERRQFGRFVSRSAAYQCAMGLAREAIASGATVEILHADSSGELRAFKLPAPVTLVA